MVMGSLRQEAEVVVIGGGPGGYVAAIRAADLGREVILVERRGRLGGVCLLEGCIPSKTLIHAVGLIDQAREAGRMGITFETPRIDTAALRTAVEDVVSGLAGGVEGLLRRRGVEIVRGTARFEGPHALALEGSEVSGIEFRHAIVATGSRPAELPLAGDLPLWTSGDALDLPRIPERLVVIGGGYIGLELGLVYAGLGARVEVVEFNPRLLAGADEDLVRVMLRNARRRLHAIHTGVRVTAVEVDGDGYRVRADRDGEAMELGADAVLVAVGRQPNSEGLGLDRAGIQPDAHGFIPVAANTRTVVPHIHAIGDVTPGPMLAHVASREAHVAAEVIAGRPAAFDNRAIPAVVFTDPEIAWTGLSESEARTRGREVSVGRFPLTALGRARTLGRTDGLVKVLSDPGSGLVLGVGIVGVNASELIAEATLALEMGATLEDLMVTIHPHPTLSESLMEAAEVAAGAAIHVMPPGQPG